MLLLIKFSMAQSDNEIKKTYLVTSSSKETILDTAMFNILQNDGSVEKIIYMELLSNGKMKNYFTIRLSDSYVYEDSIYSVLGVKRNKEYIIDSLKNLLSSYVDTSFSSWQIVRHSNYLPNFVYLCIIKKNKIISEVYTQNWSDQYFLEEECKKITIQMKIIYLIRTFLN